MIGFYGNQFLFVIDIELQNWNDGSVLIDYLSDEPYVGSKLNEMLMWLTQFGNWVPCCL